MTEDTKMLLEAMQEIAGQMSKGLQDLENRLTSRIDSIDARLTNVEKLATQTALTIENEIKPSIQIIAEQHTSLVENYQNTNKRIGKCENDIDFARLKIMKHDSDIQELKKAN
jgi:predicted  nucleic acid-binding Zn-ribbon protein